MRNYNGCNSETYTSSEMNFNTIFGSNMGPSYSNSHTTSNTLNAFPENYLYGHAYTPNQIMNNTFSPEVGLEKGTIFPELVSPYYPGQSMDFINYLRTNKGLGGM